MRPHPAIPRLLAALALAGALCYPPASPGNTAKTVPFVFSDIDNRPVRLVDYRGQWLLVAFWAPWCPLCKVQMPTLKQLDARPDLTVVGIGLDYGDPETLRGTISSHALPFRVIAGGARRAPDSPHRQVGPVDYFPTSYLYDPNGEIVMYIPGQVSASKVLNYMAGWQGAPAGQVAAARGPAYAGRAEKLAAYLKKTYGAAGGQAYSAWRALLDRAAGLSDADKLTEVNDFFNRRIMQSSDQRIWGRQDYWATLGEVLGKGAGDSEDFVIAKYFTLITLGVAPERMRLFYVKPAGAGTGDPVHMVLAWFPPGSRDPQLLDQRDPAIKPASARTDLKPVFSFNSEGVWSDVLAQTPASAGGSLPMWEDALRRARNEGFE